MQLFGLKILILKICLELNLLKNHINKICNFQPLQPQAGVCGLLWDPFEA